MLMFSSGFTFFSFASYQVLWNLASPPVEPWLNVILSFGVGLIGGMIFASVRKYGTYSLTNTIPFKQQHKLNNHQKHEKRQKRHKATNTTSYKHQERPKTVFV